MPRPPWNGQILDTRDYQQLTAPEWPDLDIVKTSVELRCTYYAFKDRRTWERAQNMLRTFIIQVTHDPEIPYMFSFVSFCSFLKNATESLLCHVHFNVVYCFIYTASP